jgi:hypothetical protein
MTSKLADSTPQLSTMSSTKSRLSQKSQKNFQWCNFERAVVQNNAASRITARFRTVSLMRNATVTVGAGSRTVTLVKTRAIVLAIEKIAAYYVDVTSGNDSKVLLT